MKLQVKNKLFFAAVAVLSLSLYGCSSKKNDSAKKNNTEITFSWWGKAPRHEYTLKGLDNFHKLYPEITVVPDYAEWDGYEDKFDRLYRENKTADVMQINFDWLYKYSPDGNGFYDLNELDDILELSNFTLSELSNGEMNGKLNALPTAFNAIIPVYNEALFAKYGLSIPETWDDLFNAAKVMRDDGYYVIGTGKKMLFLMVIAWFEQTYKKPFFLDNSTYNLTESETAGMLLFVKRLFDEKVMFPGVYTFKIDDLGKQKLASAVCWCSESSLYADFMEKQGGNPVLGNFISTPGARNSGWYLKPATMYAIKKDCSNPKQAALLVNYLLNNTDMALLQKCEKGIPVSNKSLTVLLEKNQLAKMEYLALMKIRFNKANINKMLPAMENKDMVDSFYENCISFVYNKSKLEDSASSICNDFIQILSNMN